MELEKSEWNPNLCEEFEALEAILDVSDELKIVQDEKNADNLIITVRIAPLTASDTSRQYVGLYLKIKVHKQRYPEDENPQKIDVFHVRGLDESKIEELLLLLNQR